MRFDVTDITDIFFVITNSFSSKFANRFANKDQLKDQLIE
jgi:hypothetical protein